MAAKKITMQDIADACGLSRNTVSKVFNGRGSVPEATRRQVLEQARQMGYRLLPEPADQPAPHGHSIALLTLCMPGRNHYGSNFISHFANRMSRAGYTLMIYEIQPDEHRDCRLPANFVLENTAGILCIEMFDRRYTDFICGLGLPVIFSDTYARADFSAMAGDFISMENTTSSIAVTHHLIELGARRLGFVGDHTHCNSFYERFNGFRTAVARGGLTLDPKLCIVEPNSAPYGEAAWLVERLRAMPQLPDAFVCANDYLAIHLMKALKCMELRIPEDIMVVGFDDSPEASVTEPQLSTVRIPSGEMGFIAAGILLDRIQCPTLPYRCCYIQTTPLWRATTRTPEGA